MHSHKHYVFKAFVFLQSATLRLQLTELHLL